MRGFIFATSKDNVGIINVIFEIEILLMTKDKINTS